MNTVSLMTYLGRAAKKVDLPKEEYSPKLIINESFNKFVEHLDNKVKVLKRKYPNKNKDDALRVIKKSKKKIEDVDFLRKKIELLELYSDVENLSSMKSNLNLPLEFRKKLDSKIKYLKSYIMYQFNKV